MCTEVKGGRTRVKWTTRLNTHVKHAARSVDGSQGAESTSRRRHSQPTCLPLARLLARSLARSFARPPVPARALPGRLGDSHPVIGGQCDSTPACDSLIRAARSRPPYSAIRPGARTLPRPTTTLSDALY